MIATFSLVMLVLQVASLRIAKDVSAPTIQNDGQNAPVGMAHFKLPKKTLTPIGSSIKDLSFVEQLGFSGGGAHKKGCEYEDSDFTHKKACHVIHGESHGASFTQTNEDLGTTLEEGLSGCADYCNGQSLTHSTVTCCQLQITTGTGQGVNCLAFFDDLSVPEVAGPPFEIGGPLGHITAPAYYAQVCLAAPATAPATGTGDPHIKNMAGEKFDILQVGTFSFLTVSNASAKIENSPMLVLSGAVDQVGGRCSARYIQNASLTGTWLQDLQLGVRVAHEKEASKEQERSITQKAVSKVLEVSLNGQNGPWYPASDHGMQYPSIITKMWWKAVQVKLENGVKLSFKLGRETSRKAQDLQGYHYLNVRIDGLSILRKPDVHLGGLLAFDDFQKVSAPPHECADVPSAKDDTSLTTLTKEMNGDVTSNGLPYLLSTMSVD